MENKIRGVIEANAQLHDQQKLLNKAKNEVARVERDLKALKLNNRALRMSYLSYWSLADTTTQFTTAGPRCFLRGCGNLPMQPMRHGRGC